MRQVVTSPSYIIFQQAGKIYAKNGNTGQIDFSGIDASAVIQSAINALTNGGKIIIKKGTYLLNPQNLPTGSFEVKYGTIIVGEGIDKTILKVADGVINRNKTVFKIGSEDGNDTFVFEDLTLDGNGDTQNFSASTSSDFYIGVVGKSPTASNKTHESLILRRVKFANFKMGATSTILHGIGVNTFGSLHFYVDDFYCFNNDVSLWITMPFSNSPTQGVMNNIIIRNPQASGICFEGFGDTILSNFYIYSDVLSTATGIRIFSSNEVRRLVIKNGIFKNVGIMLNVGAGGTNAVKDSIFEGLSAYNCRGCYMFSWVTDPSNVITNLLADNCAIGGIPGVTIFGSFVFEGAGVRAEQIYSINSQNNGIKIDNETYINGGAIINPALDPIYGTGVRHIKNLIGYVTENSGTATFSGDGTTTTFTIAHGLAGTPKSWYVEAGSSDAKGDKYVTADTTNLTVTFATAPPAGTNNVVLVWSAEM